MPGPHPPERVFFAPAFPRVDINGAGVARSRVMYFSSRAEDGTKFLVDRKVGARMKTWSEGCKLFGAIRMQLAPAYFSLSSPPSRTNPGHGIIFASPYTLCPLALLI